MVKSRKYIVLRPFVGEPKESDFEIIEEYLPEIKDGEFLAEAVLLSVDPYQRMKLGVKYPCDMIGGQIARVIESKCSEYPPDTWVMGHFGWRTHTVVDTRNPPACNQMPYMYALPDFEGLPVSLGLGLCGRVGNTAYFGLSRVCEPRAGETVAVSAAAGAVGYQVGQIAKIMGCRVIGIAGSDEKCKWLTDEIGFDHAINYKKEDVSERLDTAAPGGIDCYFDSVGGELSSAVMSKMNKFGRIAVCGAISTYNETQPEKLKATCIQQYIVGKELKMEGFQVNRFAESTMDGILQNLKWVKEGKLKNKEHTYQGFENAPRALIEMFRGLNIGKTLVKII